MSEELKSTKPQRVSKEYTIMRLCWVKVMQEGKAQLTFRSKKDALRFRARLYYYRKFVEQEEGFTPEELDNLRSAIAREENGIVTITLPSEDPVLTAAMQQLDGDWRNIEATPLPELPPAPEPVVEAKGSIGNLLQKLEQKGTVEVETQRVTPYYQRGEGE